MELNKELSPILVGMKCTIVLPFFLLLTLSVLCNSFQLNDFHHIISKSNCIDNSRILYQRTLLSPFTCTTADSIEINPILDKIIEESQIEKSPISSQSPTSVFLERKTFKRFMQVELWRKPELENIYPVLCSIEFACRDINRLMRRVTTDNLSGYNGGIEGAKGSVNIQGEDQKKLDVISNRIMKTSLCCSGKVSMVASEEDEEPCLCSTVTDNIAFTGEYAAVFDPLDGSSNIDSGLPTGTYG